jgi:5-formyltetrahydrofolate cyclo-ligase
VEGFDPDERNQLIDKAKRQIRGRMSSVRTVYPVAALIERSRLLVARIEASEPFQAARSVGLFWPLLDRREVDIRPLLERALTLGKRAYFPFLEADPERGPRIGFREVKQAADLTERGQRFLEPPEHAATAERGDLDLIVVPALALALSGHRIGYGGGYYDSVLPTLCPPAAAMAVGFEFQVLAELPMLEHDVACDFVVTDQRFELVPAAVTPSAP